MMKRRGVLHRAVKNGHAYSDGDSVIYAVRELHRAESGDNGEGDGAANALPFALEGDVLTIHLYDAIAEMGFMAELLNLPTPMDWVEALKTPGYSNVKIYMNSPGGTATAAFAVKAQLERLSAKGIGLECRIDGLCASAATLIASACDKVVVAQGSRYFVHKAWTCMCGNADDFATLRADLARTDEDLAEVYAKRTGKDAAAMLALMTEEPLMTAKEAMDAGFADELAGAEQAKPEPKAETKPEPKAETEEPAAAGNDELPFDKGAERKADHSAERERAAAEVEVLLLDADE